MHEQLTSSTPPPPRTSGGRTVVTPNHPEWSRLNFPHRLHHLLTSMEMEGLGHMAHWDENGLCFKIRKSDELIQKYLPFFFQQRKWKSFQRVSDWQAVFGGCCLCRGTITSKKEQCGPSTCQGSNGREVFSLLYDYPSFCLCLTNKANWLHNLIQSK